jgi:hypothetical protein
MVRPILACLGFACGMLVAQPAWSQEAEQISEGPAKASGPTKADWVAAGLDPLEYAEALQYEAGIEEWKQLVRSRKNHTTAGWSCVGVAVLGGGIVATLWLAQGWGVSEHPQMEVFAISMVAIGATLITGIVVATTSPGPEDFVQKWRADRGLSFNLGPATLHPGLSGLALTF